MASPTRTWACCHRNSLILRRLTGVEHYPVEAHTALQEFRPPASGVLAHRQDGRAAGKRLHAAATELMPMMGGHRAATV